MSENDILADFFAFEQGAGGVICEVLIQMGYKSFATGYTGNTQEKTFFPCKPTPRGTEPTPEQMTARKAAYDLGAVVSYGVMIRQFLSTASRADGKPPNWDCDQFDFTSNFASGTREIVMPSLRKQGIAVPLVRDNSWRGYVRLAWADDPYKVERDERNSQGRFDQVVYITETFAGEDAARAAIGDAGEPSASFTLSQTAIDAGWEMSALKGQKDEAIKRLPESSTPIFDDEVTKLAESWKLEPSDLYSLLGVTPM